MSSDDEADVVDSAVSSASASGAVSSGTGGAAPPLQPRLTWSTYHVGFLRNVWTFFRGVVPDEHALPRSILVDGAWVHLPHAIHELQASTSSASAFASSRHRTDVEPDEHEEQQQHGRAPALRPVELQSMARLDDGSDGGAHSTMVSLRWNGRELPTSAADVDAAAAAGSASASASAASFPDTPPLHPEPYAYTRPVRILGHAKIHPPAAVANAPAPDTDEEDDHDTMTSVRL